MIKPGDTNTVSQPRRRQVAMVENHRDSKDRAMYWFTHLGQRTKSNRIVSEVSAW